MCPFRRLKQSAKSNSSFCVLWRNTEMSIHLFKHNQEAYNSVTAMLEWEKMAAVIHPTGTGKSLIAFKLAEEHPSEKFLWLSPSDISIRHSWRISEWNSITSSSCPTAV